MQQDYTYAVARIRYRETALLSDADLSGLVSAKDTESVIRMLRDKGWGTNESSDTPEGILAAEKKKLWDFIGEIVPDRSVLEFLSAPNDFHNLKVAVKCITRDILPDGLFLDGSSIESQQMYDAIRTREYDAFPEHLREVAKEAMTVLLQTADGQLCDIIVDKACMDYVYSLGRGSENDIIRLYCELFVACADIKIAVRAAKTKKPLDFIRRAMAQCESLDTEKLALAASLGYDDILAYLSVTKYSSAVEAISTSMSAFEKWCDDYLTKVMKPQKWEPFSIGPVVAYIIARENELKAVRLILSSKASDLSDKIVKERLRSMYV